MILKADNGYCWQVTAVVVFLVLMVQVRAEYTMYTQWRGGGHFVRVKVKRNDTDVWQARRQELRTEVLSSHPATLVSWQQVVRSKFFYVL